MGAWGEVVVVGGASGMWGRDLVSHVPLQVHARRDPYFVLSHHLCHFICLMNSSLACVMFNVNVSFEWSLCRIGVCCAGSYVWEAMESPVLAD